MSYEKIVCWGYATKMLYRIQRGLCAICDIGYNKNFSQCVQCPVRSMAIVQFISFTALFVIFCVIISLTDKCNVDFYSYSGRRSPGAKYRTLADILIASFKILFGFYQILISIIHGLSNVHWPENLMRAIKILQYIQFQILTVP